MESAEVRTFLLGAVVGLVVVGVPWALATWRRRRKTIPPVIIQQIQLPIANPTSSDPAMDGHDADTDDLAHRPPARATDPSVKTVEEARYHRRLRSLSLELERVERENAEIRRQRQTSQNQLFKSEAGLDQARNEIAEIRGIVLQLGATKTDQDVIDLR